MHMMSRNEIVLHVHASWSIEENDDDDDEKEEVKHSCTHVTVTQWQKMVYGGE